MIVGILSNKKSYLPEIIAYKNYFIENNRYKAVFVFTASVRFLLDVNYKNELQLINQELYKSTNAPGYVSSSMMGLHALNSKNRQSYSSDSKIKSVWNNQALATVFDLNFIRHCKDLHLAYYNQGLSYGWGVELDLYFLAKSHGYIHGYFTSMPVYWIRNFTSVRDGSQSTYHKNAGIEVLRYLSSSSVRRRFFLRYSRFIPQFILKQ